MTLSMDKAEETIQRLRQFGPVSFDDAVIVGQLFCRAAERATVGGFVEIGLAMAELMMWGSHLKARHALIIAETKRLESEHPIRCVLELSGSDMEKIWVTNQLTESKP